MWISKKKRNQINKKKEGKSNEINEEVVWHGTIRTGDEFICCRRTAAAGGETVTDAAVFLSFAPGGDRKMKLPLVPFPNAKQFVLCEEPPQPKKTASEAFAAVADSGLLKAPRTAIPAMCWCWLHCMNKSKNNTCLEDSFFIRNICKEMKQGSYDTERRSLYSASARTVQNLWKSAYCPWRSRRTRTKSLRQNLY